MWKFFHNGDGWWLKIETKEQLAAYIDETMGPRFGESMMRVAKRNKETPELRGHYETKMDNVIDSLWHCQLLGNELPSMLPKEGC